MALYRRGLCCLSLTLRNRAKIRGPQPQYYLLYYVQISPQGVDLREARDVLRLKRWVCARRFCYAGGM